MKKETIIAVVLGIVIGLIVAVIVVYQTKEMQLSKSRPINNQLQTNQTSNNINANQTYLDIVSPEDKIIVEKANILIKGKANKNSVILIQSPIKDIVLKNDKESFETKFPLVFGENEISIAVYPEEKGLNPLIKGLRVYYLDEK